MGNQNHAARAVPGTALSRGAGANLHCLLQDDRPEACLYLSWRETMLRVLVWLLATPRLYPHPPPRGTVEGGASASFPGADSLSLLPGESP